jgi:hypothetical protein
MSTPQKNDALHINLLETERSLVALGCDAACGFATPRGNCARDALSIITRLF